MPTYEYHCDACGHNFDEFQSITSDPLKKCPECGKLKLRRLFGTGAGFLFKGSGFYQTDYRSESYKAGVKADEPAGKTAQDSKAAANGKGSTAESSGTSGGAKSGKKTSKSAPRVSDD
jgi:putative FmdB family regulatory protein